MGLAELERVGRVPGRAEGTVTWGRGTLLASAIGVCLAGSAADAGAQTCQVNNQASCIAEGGAITIRLTRAARLLAPTTTLTLPQADIPAFQSGFGSPEMVAFTLQSNSPWSLGVQGGAAVWTAVPGSARQDKPVSDLQWSTTPGGPYTNLTGALATAQTGSPTGNGVVTLYLRSRYTWSLDRPGSYTIPLVVVLTAP
jgi:hypothetical protein